MFPKTATSQQARDKLNKKTDDLPNLKETGSELTGGGDPIGAQNPKDVGKAVDKATPDVDLTKNPKSLGKDAVKGAKNALPDVSAVPTREEIIKKVTVPRVMLASAVCTTVCLTLCLESLPGCSCHELHQLQPCCLATLLSAHHCSQLVTKQVQTNIDCVDAAHHCGEHYSLYVRFLCLQSRLWYAHMSINQDSYVQTVTMIHSTSSACDIHNLIQPSSLSIASSSQEAGKDVSHTAATSALEHAHSQQADNQQQHTGIKSTQPNKLLIGSRCNMFHDAWQRLLPFYVLKPAYRHQ